MHQNICNIHFLMDKNTDRVVSFMSYATLNITFWGFNVSCLYPKEHKYKNAHKTMNHFIL